MDNVSVKKFPSIGQFRDAIRAAREFNYVPRNGKIPYIGTVKVHGTNAGIVFSPQGTWFQSRSRILSQANDHMGFCAYMDTKIDYLRRLKRNILDRSGWTGDEKERDLTVEVFGEWCGEGIQKGVGVSKLPRMFIVFGVRIDGVWQDNYVEEASEPEVRIYSIHTFGNFRTVVDFEHLEETQNMLARHTLQVEEKCPVASYFGVTGVGEGIVWKPAYIEYPDLWFKVKGEKHRVTEAKTLVPIAPENLATIEEFVAKTVTENRLQQGLFWLKNECQKELDMKNIGDFLRWVHTDILKEESDTLEASNLDPKKIGKYITPVAKNWYIQQLNDSFK